MADGPLSAAIRSLNRPLNPGDREEHRKGGAAWAVVCAAYLVCFGALLIATKGLPYGIDNNESFSSLWHARHMYDLRLSQTMGLADEVWAWHAAASPYVHTHQGNFPRLFAFLLYFLGARSIESQIAITTFTVGLAAIWLAFRFLRTLGPPLFAALGCLVLITDYGLFGQWQVDTYRVWYGFFFFGSLYWVSQLGRRQGWAMLAAGIVLFAAVFYGEYVFASFTGLMAGGYALFCNRRSPRDIMRTAAAILIGGASAAAVLLTQLVAYMGWQNVKLDIRYTLAARNMARDPAFADTVDKFYHDHRIVFWNNYFDVTRFRTTGTFVTSLFEKHLQYYTPWVCLSAMVLLAGALAGLLRGGETSPSRLPASVRFAATRVLPGLLLAAFAFTALRYLRPLFNESSGTLWKSALGVPPPGWAGWVAFAAAGVIALTIAVAGTNKSLGREGGLEGLFALSLCVIVAYAAVYRVFTGYMFSGYLNRQAPFLVFWTDILLGGALYIVASATLRGFAGAPGGRAASSLRITGAFLLVLFAGAWATLQACYLIVVPPDGEPFLHLVSKSPYRGSSFVANDYPAPVSDKAHSWAYADSSIFSGQVKLTPDGFAVEHDTHYLWFADADENKSYLKPDYGVLMDQPASISEALTEFNDRISHFPHPIAFDTMGIIKRTQEPLQPFLSQRLVATDGRRYSIVRFDWDFPPFLRPVDDAMRAAAKSMSFQQKIAFSETGQEQLRRWRIEIQATESAAGTQGGGPVQLSEASIDGRQIFTDEAMAAAGWTLGPPGQGTGGISWIGVPGRSRRLSTVVVGDIVTLRLLAGPGKGTAAVAINDMTQDIFLGQPELSERVISLNTAAARDRYTAVPRLAPGTFVNTWLTAGNDGPAVIVGYAYSHQEGAPEDGTTIRVYDEPRPGSWQLADAVTFLGSTGIPVRMDEFRDRNPDTLNEYARVRGRGDARTYAQWLADHLAANPADRNWEGIVEPDPSAGKAAQGPGGAPSQFRTIPLPPGLEGRVQISVTPGTRTKSGPEYFGQIFEAGRIAAAPQGVAEPMLAELPRNFEAKALAYGYISLHLRFPTRPLSATEPIISAGVEEAGDFIYVIYSDSNHVRLGFDHWFKGGPSDGTNRGRLYKGA